MAVHSVDLIGGVWRVVRDGRPLEGEYASKTEALGALRAMLQAEFGRGGPTPPRAMVLGLATDASRE